MSSSPRFEWRELVYCDTCNPSRRLERACAGAVARFGNGETSTCAECIRKLQSMGYTDAHGPVCVCGHPLDSRHGLRARLGRALEQHLRSSSPATAFEVMRVGVLLERCEACAAVDIEHAALELAGGMLARNGGEHGR